MTSTQRTAAGTGGRSATAGRGSTTSDLALIRHRINFDPVEPSHFQFAATPDTAEAAELARQFHVDPIPWPQGLAPTPAPLQPAPKDSDPLPPADLLVVTYTTAEARAAADVLSPGAPVSSWTDYRHNWPALKKQVAAGAPSLAVDRAARWTRLTIGATTVVLVKSELHPATDGPKLPIRVLWQQLIDEVRPKVAITTGTAGGVSDQVLLGDVIVSQSVRWDCTTRFAKAPFAEQEYADNDPISTTFFEQAARDLIPVNAKHLPAAGRAPVILGPGDTAGTTLTADFFAFDDASDHYGLRAYQPDARAVEMDDAALPLALVDNAAPPMWVSIRNASDPQMDGRTLADEKRQASAIYEKYGYFTTVGSAIAVWAVAAGLQAA